jgi:hypothetical protein
MLQGAANSQATCFCTCEPTPSLGHCVPRKCQSLQWTHDLLLRYLGARKEPKKHGEPSWRITGLCAYHSRENKKKETSGSTWPWGPLSAVRTLSATPCVTYRLDT